VSHDRSRAVREYDTAGGNNNRLLPDRRTRCADPRPSAPRALNRRVRPETSMYVRAPRSFHRRPTKHGKSGTNAWTNRRTRDRQRRSPVEAPQPGAVYAARHDVVVRRVLEADERFAGVSHSARPSEEKRERRSEDIHHPSVGPRIHLRSPRRRTPTKGPRSCRSGPGSSS
jgi:hypothetical protein